MNGEAGHEIVYLEEWLVRDLDGGVCFYTDAEIAQGVRHRTQSVKLITQIEK